MSIIFSPIPITSILATSHMTKIKSKVLILLEFLQPLTTWTRTLFSYGDWEDPLHFFSLHDAFFVATWHRLAVLNGIPSCLFASLTQRLLNHPPFSHSWLSMVLTCHTYFVSHFHQTTIFLTIKWRTEGCSQKQSPQITTIYTTVNWLVPLSTWRLLEKSSQCFLEAGHNKGRDFRNLLTIHLWNKWTQLGQVWCSSHQAWRKQEQVSTASPNGGR